MIFLKKHKEKAFLIFMFCLFVFVRSINFISFLNFSHDQGKFSSEVLKIYKEKSLILIGPSISFNSEGLEIFQGSVIYYFLLIFLLFGGFDPVKSSYIFMLFAALMLVPLYFGAKFLSDKKSAKGLVVLYTLFPFYIDYTRFLWNPNFQFSLLPLLIFFMGLFERERRGVVLFFIALYSGLLLQFHYQFGIVILGLLIYYFVVKRNSPGYALVFILGFVVGFSPLILFELRHDFYNLRTALLFITNNMFLSNVEVGKFPPHYILSISFFVFVLIFSVLRRYISKRALFALGGVIFIFCALIYLPIPSHAFGMADNWNYSFEEKVHNIIMRERVRNFNVVNLIYDTEASVQKYLLEKDNVNINERDYYNNEYVFVISDEESFEKSVAYEVRAFQSLRPIKQWSINKKYELYLFKR